MSVFSCQVRLQVLGYSCLSHVSPLSRARVLNLDLALLDSYVKAGIVFCTNHFDLCVNNARL